MTPSRICHNSQIVTSPIKIAEITNQFYIDKVTKLSNVIRNEVRDPLAVLSRLIPRKENNPFQLKLISRKDTFNLIKWVPNTNSTGVDSINNKIIKKLGWSIVPQLRHMIITVICTGIFPEFKKKLE